ncbi:MAG: hypothetical protein OEX02_05025 [Cyclobacteriaceae bacterium]|nr:hypothetical protein [Cyclobacteriaceae bacterium]
MDDKLKDQELIDGYINGTLTTMEKQLFEERMRTDKEFEQEAKETRLIAKAIRKIEREKVYNRLQQFKADRPSGRQVFMTPQRTYLAIAASLALIAASFFVIKSLSPSAHQKVFTAYYSPPDNLHVGQTRGDDDPATVEVVKFFQNKQYDNCVRAISSLEDPVRDRPEIEMMLGLSHMELKQFDKAVPPLEKLAGKTTGYKTMALWYLALTYLAEERTDEAVETLSEIPPGSPYPLEALKNELIEVQENE